MTFPIHERGQAEYEEALTELSRRGDADLTRVEPDVRAILDAVRDRGDAAIRELTERFEGRTQAHVVVPEGEWRGLAREAP